MILLVWKPSRISDINLRITYVLTSVFLLNWAVWAGGSEVAMTFPPKFMFGVATSAYQVEGGWREGGKGESIWDHLTHHHPELISDRSSGDVAADSYHRLADDIALLRALGVNFYRFSISWPRILPSGLSEHVISDGVAYYDRLIDQLIRHNITPVVTMYHWDLPQALSDLGGWTNPLLADYFLDYARVLFDKFGDRVRTWITFNEPKNVCVGGYETAEYAPGHAVSGRGGYMCAHTLLRAHAMTYRLYERHYRHVQHGEIGITLIGDWMEAASHSREDKEAAERAMQFQFGWFAHPIFSAAGDWPAVMRHNVDRRSSQQGLRVSRLPRLSARERDMLRGSADFLGLNYYTSRLVSAARAASAPPPLPSYHDDAAVTSYQDESWAATNSTWLKVVPWGLRSTLGWLRREYGNPVVLVTENGVSLPAGAEDPRRIAYLRAHLRSLLLAMRDGSRVRGYAHWSLLDNFEWRRGYSERFGLFEVDFASDNRTRTPRRSAAYYRRVIETRQLLPVLHAAGGGGDGEDAPAPVVEAV